MAVRQIKQNTAARRNMSVSTFEEITKKKPEKSLLAKRKQKSGRNNQGKITIRHRGGGAKRAIRVVDFRMQETTDAKIVAIEYDPGRTSRIALVQLADGSKAYVPALVGMKVGQTISAGSEIEIKSGNRMPLSVIPVGSVICNIELTPGRGGQLVRGAGARAQLMAKDGDYGQVRLPSGEVRLVLLTCLATLGQIGNLDHQNIRIGSAGRKRHMGIRPTVRGKAMNPVDHPHGGGEGGTDIGLKHQKTPWGKPALGKKTRRRKLGAKMIIRRRGKGNR